MTQQQIMADPRQTIEEVFAQVILRNLRARGHDTSVWLIQYFYTTRKDHLFSHWGGVWFALAVTIVVFVGRGLLAVQRVLVFVSDLLITDIDG